MGVAAVWAVGLGFLRSGAALGRAVEGLELAAVLRDADVGAAGVEPLAAGPIAAAGADRRRWGRASPHHWGAVDGVVVVPTGPLLSSVLRLDAVVMRQSPPVAFVVASGASGDDVETCNLPMNLQFVDGGSDGSSLGDCLTSSHGA